MNEISPHDELLGLVADLIATLEWESVRGALVLPSEPVRAAPIEPTASAPVRSTAPVEHSRAAPARPAVSPSPRAPLPAQWAQWTAKRGQALDELHVAIGACRACARCEGRKQVVVGEGHGTSGLMVVATEPGEIEERANGPLRGAPGEMLDRMLENVLKLRRAQCYVTTVLHCRPQKGESPEQRTASVRACTANLEREIAVVRPRVIMAFGALPTRVLVGDGVPYEAALGKWHEALGAFVLPTFDLAHLVARPADKRLAMAHLLAVSERLAPAS
jgi:uracil-DNA glycosylase family 4